MYQFKYVNAGNGEGGSTLSLGPSPFRPAAPRGLGAQIADKIGKLPYADIDLVVDLGSRIGTGEWFRGLATCLALCYAALSFAPGMTPVVGASPAPLAGAQYDEARAYSFGPLAYGADTGRRMAATDAVRPLTDIPERPTITMTAILGRGDSFSRVLRRAGASEAEASQLQTLISSGVDLADIKAGTPLELTLGRRPNKQVARPVDNLVLRARFDLKIIVQRIEGQLKLSRIPIAVDNTPLRIQGRVGSGLYRAARASGAPAKAVEAYLRAISSQINVGAIGANDKFDLIIEHRRAETGETETGNLLYAGLERATGKKVQLLQWNSGGNMQWFEASGVGKQSGMLQRPVPGVVSSNFGMRLHPILGYSRMHKGLDFRAGYGTPILAAADGRVAAAGWAGGYGQQVKINHTGNLATSYSHMSRIVARPGAYIRQGQVIGYVGSSGLSTGPHLHYELYVNGVQVNPASVKFTQRTQLSGSELTLFRNRLRNLLAVPVGGTPAQDVRTAEAGMKAGKTGKG